MNQNDNQHILIVGAGFAGIGMAIRLRHAGIVDFTVIEQASSPGGTWRDNTYPGLACDIPSYMYSYSFEQKPDWSRLFAPQPEILAYLEHCAQKYGVLAHVRFNTTVVAANFDEKEGLWHVRTGDGETLVARVLISGSGHALRTPVYPQIEGRENFQGKTMHSSRWDHDFPLEGKSVAVVGTGASAIQIIPSIAAKAGKLHVFQRTASWVLPKPDRPIRESAKRFLNRWPAAQRVLRAIVYGILESYAVGYVVEPRLNVLREWHSRYSLSRCVRDPDLKKKLTPTFRLGCKRILLTNDYYPALVRENVELVSAPIAAIRAQSILTADGVERPVDVIAFATGFETAEATLPFEIRGREGRSLEKVWSGGAEAYLGTTTTGFPNLFFILGPNTGLGHNSMVFMMESQFRYLLDAIRTMRARSLRSVEVRPEEQARYNEWIRKRLSRTVWNTGGCNSWYLTSTGKNTTAWPGFTFEFWARTRRFDVENYKLGS